MCRAGPQAPIAGVSISVPLRDALFISLACSVREILRKKIREKDAMIDNLLARLNPTAPSATPLSLNVARLALTPDQRAAYRDVLSYFEKSQSVRTVEKKIDVSTLDEDSEYESDSDNDTEGGDADDAASSVFQPHVPTKCTPTGLLAKSALETRSRSRLSSPETSNHGRTESEGSEETTSTGAGIGNPSYFEPGEIQFCVVQKAASHGAGFLPSRPFLEP